SRNRNGPVLIPLLCVTLLCVWIVGVLILPNAHGSNKLLVSHCLPCATNCPGISVKAPVLLCSKLIELLLLIESKAKDCHLKLLSVVSSFWSVQIESDILLLSNHVRTLSLTNTGNSDTNTIVNHVTSLLVLLIKSLWLCTLETIISLTEERKSSVRLSRIRIVAWHCCSP